MNSRRLGPVILITLMLQSACVVADARLSKQKGCASCHGGVRGVTVIQEMKAPPMQQIMAKYRGQPEVENELVRKVADESKHPPVKATEAERRQLVRFFLGIPN